MIDHWWGRSIFGVPIVRDVFIETGCRDGDTLWTAKDHFSICHSIEIDEAAFLKCHDRFRGSRNVNLHFGDSREVLPLVIDTARPTTFYLDAHCEGAPSVAPSDTECPLLDELRIIVAAPWKSKPVILIDNIHMMGETYWQDPASNHSLFKSGDWPRIDQIAKILHDYRFHEDAENRVGLWA